MSLHSLLNYRSSYFSPRAMDWLQVMHPAECPRSLVGPFPSSHLLGPVFLAWEVSSRGLIWLRFNCLGFDRWGRQFMSYPIGRQTVSCHLLSAVISQAAQLGGKSHLLPSRSSAGPCAENSVGTVVWSVISLEVSKGCFEKFITFPHLSVRFLPYSDLPSALRAISVSSLQFRQESLGRCLILSIKYSFSQ